MKTCTNCKKLLPLSKFGFNRSRSDGIQGECKDCRNAYSKKWRKTNPDKVKAYNKEYRKTHHEYYVEKGKEWYRANTEKSYFLTKKWRENNTERANLYARQWKIDNYERHVSWRAVYRDVNREKEARDHKSWVQAHPERCRDYCAKRRALKRNATIEPLPDKYEIALYEAQHGLCYYCGTSLAETKQHLEHMIPLSRGGAHALSNLVLSCIACNLQKHTMTAEEFIEKKEALQLA